jgi:hypothetical protein
MSESTQSAGTDPIERLAASVNAFAACIRALPDDVFPRRFTDWAPRDVVAHLIGWNRATLDAIPLIRRGEMPSYIMDLPNDFANVNAASVRTYSATEQATLLDTLDRSADELLAALRSLDPWDWMHDFGARNPIGQPILIQRQVDALADDYRAHAHEIERWAHGEGSSRTRAN